jgi:hypothetical protein
MAACVGAGVQIASDGDPADVRQVADIAPFPRTVMPLPVPEVTFQEGPWRDEPSFGRPAEAEGFVARCTGASSPPCVLAKRSGSD